MAFKVVHSHGLTERADTYAEAESVVRAVYGADVTIGHPGDISDGGDRTLCWQGEPPEDDAGSRACCYIAGRAEVADAAKLARELYSDDLSREPEQPIQRDGGKAYDAWLQSARDGGDTDTRDALLAVDRADFAAAWNAIVAEAEQ